ncbi:hypothetical protein FHS10_004947 [Mucilaginibacter dorajii]|nr:hypothetical protein [Mucilaginibacter dorajii]
MCTHSSPKGEYFNLRVAFISFKKLPLGTGGFTYQIFTLLSGASHILSPFLIWKAS